MNVPTVQFVSLLEIQERKFDQSIYTWVHFKIFYFECNFLNKDFTISDEDYGIIRIKKALSAHMWPKMRMKPQKKERILHNEVRF